VRGLVRSGRAADLPAGVHPALSRGLDDHAALEAAVAGVDAVVHLAARVHVMDETAADPAAEFHRVNVEGTRTLLEHAISAGVGRFVFASSVKAMGESGGAALDEETPPSPVDPYGMSKLEAERLVAGAADRIHVTSLRFPLLYGPGMKGNMLRLFQLVDRGIPIPLASVRNRRSILYLGNAGSAIESVLGSNHPSGEVFLCADPVDVSTPQLIRAIGVALGRPARLLPFPMGVLRAAARAGDLVGAWRTVSLNTAAFDRLFGSLYVDAGKLQRSTGYRPPHDLASALAETARWYRSRVDA
jgi:nucleoside-diphosphate-sugar epimerase